MVSQPPPGGNNHGAKEAAALDPAQQSSQEVQQVFGFDLDPLSSLMIAVMLLLGLVQRKSPLHSAEGCSTSASDRHGFCLCSSHGSTMLLLITRLMNCWII